MGWILAIALAVVDIFNRYLGLELEPVYFAGILRYTTPVASLPIVTVIVTFFVLLIGLGFWIRTQGKWSWLFWGTLIGLIGNVLPISQFGTLPGSAAEFLMVLLLLLTEQYSQRQLPDLGLESDSSAIFSYLYSNWVLINRQPKGVVYFIGGAGFDSFPTVFYRYLLTKIYEAGYTVVALPFRFTLNHWSVAINLVKDAKPLRKAIAAEALRRNSIYGENTYQNLDLYSDPKRFKNGEYFWLGHSLGCKYIALLELLGDTEQIEQLCQAKNSDLLEEFLEECVGDKKVIQKIQKTLEQIEDPAYISLFNQPSILMAPVITGIEGAIPIKAIANLVKPWFDARPSKAETQCLIAKKNLFHFTSIVKFKSDRVEAKAKTIKFLRQTLPKNPPMLYEELEGKHLAPLNLLKRNEELGDLLVQWLPTLKKQVQKNSHRTPVVEDKI